MTPFWSWAWLITVCIVVGYVLGGILRSIGFDVFSVVILCGIAGGAIGYWWPFHTQEDTQ